MPGTPLYQLIIHLMLVGVSIMVAFWYYILYIKYADVYAKFVEMTLTLNSTGGMSSSSKQTMECNKSTVDFSYYLGLGVIKSLRWPGFRDENRKNKLWERSLQDLIAIYVPYMIMAGVVTILACFTYDPTMKYLLYNALPETRKNWITFWICMLEEIRVLLVDSGLVISVFQVQVIAFDLVKSDAEDMRKFIMKR